MWRLSNRQTIRLAQHFLDSKTFLRNKKYYRIMQLRPWIVSEMFMMKKSLFGFCLRNVRLLLVLYPNRRNLFLDRFAASFVAYARIVSSTAVTIVQSVAQ